MFEKKRENNFEEVRNYKRVDSEGFILSKSIHNRNVEKDMYLCYNKGFYYTVLGGYYKHCDVLNEIVLCFLKKSTFFYNYILILLICNYNLLK